jgi:hypothetical protein
MRAPRSGPTTSMVSMSFRLRIRRGTPGFLLQQVRDFRTFGSRDLPDRIESNINKLYL